jgi:hypothetical protein
MELELVIAISFAGGFGLSQVVNGWIPKIMLTILKALNGKKNRR